MPNMEYLISEDATKRLMEAVLAHPDLQGLRRWMLATADAHELYRRFGFAELSQPDRFMQRHDPDVYTINGAG
jgi:N-acetylglutamate synthase-like GNAT family acetyltransferase